MMAMNGHRYIRFDKEWVYDHTRPRRWKRFPKRSKRITAVLKGKFPFLEKFESTVYHHVDGRVFRFDTEGRLLGKVEEAGEEGRARLYVSGKEIPEWFLR